ncbi:MAG: DUF882 domain-containing protein [Polyangiaceae bacterium]|nr:DUF882 domain-containing protein [Polyangiaceae bacterium]
MGRASRTWWTRAGAALLALGLALVGGRAVLATAATEAADDGPAAPARDEARARDDSGPAQSAPAVGEPAPAAPATSPQLAPLAADAGAAAVVAPPAATAPVHLKLRSVRDGERIELRGPELPPAEGAAATSGRPLAPPPPWSLSGEETARASAFFRSVHGGAVEVDARLLTVLARIGAAVGGREIALVSGYREAGGTTGRGSYHVSGMAADIAIDGKTPFAVYLLARAAGATGVGLYAGFVHVDVRSKPYFWSGGGGGAPRPASVAPRDGAK